MGSDSFQNLPNWKNGNVIMERYPIIVYNRPGFVLENAAQNVTLIDAPLLDISSTFIRKLLQEGKSIKFLVPDQVIDEIEKSRYYLK